MCFLIKYFSINNYLSIKKAQLIMLNQQMASIRGFEPPTYRLGGDCSIQLSYIDITKIIQHSVVYINIF